MPVMASRDRALTTHESIIQIFRSEKLIIGTVFVAAVVPSFGEH